MNARYVANLWRKARKRISRRLQTKLMVSFAGIGIFAVLFVGFYSFHLAKQALLFRTFEQLTAAREAKRVTIEEFINNKLDGAELSTSSIVMDQVMTGLMVNPNLEVNNKPVNIFLKGGDYKSIIVIFDTANYAFGHFTDRIRFTDQVFPEMKRHISKIYHSLRHSKNSAVFDYVMDSDTLLMTVAAPAFYPDGTFRAIVALNISLSSINRIMLASTPFEGLGNTGETYLVGEDLIMRSTSRFNPSSVTKVRVNSTAAREALAGRKRTIISTDYRGEAVLSSYSPLNIPGLHWVILAEIDEHEILMPVRTLSNQVLMASGIVLLILIVLVRWNSKQLSKPLVKLRSLALNIANGAYGDTISVTTNDEVGQLTEAFNTMSLQIRDQRNQLEEKNREILDSITYAKRIQTGLLPSSRLIESLLNESFVLYVPKHIVSGDFYYIGSERGQVIIAVGDCTGHGVPGAFVSGICLGALQRTIKGFRRTKPSAILDQLNTIVAEMFSASELDIRDGMDISVCSIDLEGKTLQYAGANNSLLYIRNNKIYEIKADRQSIGKNYEEKPFHNHELELQEGDCIYMFSDGYADQFGGPHEKKFMLSRLKKLLIEIHQKPMVTQKYLLEETLVQWKGERDQIDDICVFGTRL